MPAYLSFRKKFLVERLGGDQVLLRSEHEDFLLEGKLYAALAPLLDGSRTIIDIVQALQPGIPYPAVIDALERLAEKGYLGEITGELNSDDAAFWDIQDIEPSHAIEKLGTLSVNVLACGTLERNEYSRLLALAGLSLSESGCLDVVFTDDYLCDDLQRLNLELIRKARPWMLVKPVGRNVWIGPLFRSTESGCWNCLASRLYENRWVESALRRSGRRISAASLGSLAITRSLAVDVAALEIQKWAAGANDRLEHEVVVLDCGTLEVSRHYVVRRPQCPACGDASMTNRIVPPVFHPHPKLVQDGGVRTRPADQTLADIEKHVSAIAGILRSPQNLRTAFDGFFQVHQAVQNMALSPEHRYSGRPTGVLGKGVTEAQAKASCLAEGLERYSAHFRGDERRIAGALKAVGGPAWHPYELLGFSEGQYSTRDEWNRAHDSFQWVPCRFDETREIDWTAAWSLTRQREELLPTAFCYLRYPTPPDHDFCRGNANGCAAGNVIEEAVIQGFLELVERDAVGMWWYNRARRPGVKLESFSDPFLANARDVLRRHGRTLHLLDLKTDFGIPVFVAVSWDLSGGSILFGMGAHFLSRLAADRAVAELGQVLMNDDRSLLSNDTQSWLSQATIRDQEYVVPEGENECTPGTQLDTENLAGDIEVCIDLCRQRGLELLMLDLTRPDVGFPVVRMIVPGLRHFWRRLGPGRLYDIPVRLEWIPRPFAEHELNPWPFFL